MSRTQSPNIIHKMYRIQLKNRCHTKPRKSQLEYDKTFNWYQYWLNQMLELSDKHFRAAGIKMLQKWITYCLETKNQKTQKRSKNYKKQKQLETIELKNTITEIKKKTPLTKWSQYGDAILYSISKCEYRAIEFSQFNWQKLNIL